MLPKLKYEHVRLTSYSKMRVDLASQVLSESVANALELTGGEEVSETVKFVRMMDKFFDCLNVTNLVNGRYKRKSFQDPYTSKDDFRLKWLEEELMPYLKEWEESVSNRKGFNKKDQLMMLLAKETRVGITVTVKSFLELVRYLFTIPGVKYFLSERVSQDPLENFFGCQRQRGGANENPNVAQFCKNTQALRIINSVCGTVSKSNSRGNKKAIDLQAESKPMPKRHKVKKKKVPMKTFPATPDSVSLSASMISESKDYSARLPDLSATAIGDEYPAANISESGGPPSSSLVETDSDTNMSEDIQ